MDMRLHIVSLPQTQTTKEYSFCAYTQKVVKLGKMLQAHGHEMILYSGVENEAQCAEHVTIVSDEDLHRWFGGPWDTDKVFDQWDPTVQCWMEMADHAITAIRERVQPGDAIGIIAGLCQQRIADAFPNNPVLEWGIGYSGTLGNSFRCFESRAWQHYVAGFNKDDNGRFFDVVIPNSFDPDEFIYSATKDDYLLFIGRMIPRKGLAIVGELAKNHRVITAGQGDERVSGAEHRGLVRGKERAELFAHARAVLVPTIYLEPFGGVAVEAMMSGTPVITTDYGAFPETCLSGITGYRCSMLSDFEHAVASVAELEPDFIRRWAIEKFSLDAVAPRYDAWLKQIETLSGKGWYAETNEPYGFTSDRELFQLFKDI